MLLNWWAVVSFCAMRRKASSWVPLLGGLFGAIACYLSPFPVANRYYWLPFVLDWGSIPGLLYTVVYLAWQRGVKEEKGTE